MLRFSITAFAQIIGTMMAAPASAEQSPPPEKILIGSMPEAPPYVFEHPSRGIDIDTIRAVFTSMGMEATFLHVPSMRLDRLFISGRVAAISTNSEAVAGCVPSEPFSLWRDAVIVRRSLLKPVTSMVDLAGLNVATFPKAERALGEALVPFVRYFGSYNYLINTDALSLLSRGRLDAYIGDRNMVDYAFLQGYGKGEQPYRVAFDLAPTPRLLCFRDPDLAGRFNATLARLQASGEDKTIAARYSLTLPETETPAPPEEAPAPVSD